MGNSNSRIDKCYGNYEKSFERLETDVERLKTRSAARAQRQAHLRWWTGAGVALAFAVSVGVIYQVQSQPHGTHSYQQHFRRVGAAVALPAVAVVMQWMLLLLLNLVDDRDRKKLEALEAAKRSMIKELKDMSRFDKIKSLIDKFDPDAPRSLQAGGVAGLMQQGQPQGPSRRQQQHFQQQQQHGGQVPGLLMKGSGQVAGAAALAVAGAGKAIMPLLDKVASSLMSDNPMLLEDLRRAQVQLRDAEMRMMNAVQESFAVKAENLDLKERLVELEKQLDLPPSYNVDILHEQLHQQQSEQQQLPWLAQPCIQAGGMAQSLISTSNLMVAGGDAPIATSTDEHRGEAGCCAGGDGWSELQPTATSAPQTPVSAARGMGKVSAGDAGGNDWGATGAGGEVEDRSAGLQSE